MSNTSANFYCNGHCFGTSTCPYAELIWKDGKIIGTKCKIPKKISENIWMFEEVWLRSG